MNATSKKTLDVLVRMAGALLVLNILLAVYGKNGFDLELVAAFATYAYLTVPSAVMEGAYGPWLEFYEDIKGAKARRTRIRGYAH
ncbi:MAG: hypothetical protein JWO96_1, partial [Candidatus Saccharibacteria bacterium]|nr:hypothetical protein [Candidatus Saccharibacteria bacterium]